jgi:hypothetical protein
MADVRLEGTAIKQFQKAPRAVQAELRARAAALASDPQLGAYVPLADVFNKATRKKWEARVGPLRNLYKVELRDGWRALYTVGSRGADRVVLVLEVVDHKAYERLMGY